MIYTLLLFMFLSLVRLDNVMKVRGEISYLLDYVALFEFL